MELAEPVELINEQLKREFGCPFDDRPEWRVVFSQNKFEKRQTKYTDEGIELLFPEVRELPKYRQYITERYILERLIPIHNNPELLEKVGYEACWTFQDKNGNYLPPRFDACKYLIQNIHEAAGRKVDRSWLIDPDATAEGRKKRLDDMEAFLFGNETPVGDALAYGYGISVPNKQFGDSNGK